MVPERSMAMAAGVLFNVTGRGSPDILLFGSNLWCVRVRVGVRVRIRWQKCSTDSRQAANPVSVHVSLRNHDASL